jgi:hypothetical protein
MKSPASNTGRAAPVGGDAWSPGRAVGGGTDGARSPRIAEAVTRQSPKATHSAGVTNPDTEPPTMEAALWLIVSTDPRYVRKPRHPGRSTSLVSRVGIGPARGERKRRP